MPPTIEETTDNGIYEYEESSLSITNEDIENTPVDDFDSPPENDFSEYMWMENEEEFDKEVNNFTIRKYLVSYFLVATFILRPSCNLA